jgi:gliding motility-associated-like protein
MSRTLRILFLLFLATRTCAQCGYTASLRTSKDYCLGSSLVINTKHTLQRIVWYKDGQPVDSTLANQYIPSTPLKKSTPKFIPGVDIVSDESGALYGMTFAQSMFQLTKWDPRTGDTTVLGEGDVQYGDAFYGVARLAVDHGGNVYMASSKPAAVFKFTPGSSSTTVVATGPVSNFFGFGFGLAVDCAGNVFVGNENTSEITRWAPGATTGTLVAGGGGIGVGTGKVTNIGQIALDTLGNIYVLEGHDVTKWTPGATDGRLHTAWSLDDFGPTDMYLDGTDTAWIIGWYAEGPNRVTISLWKAAPGGSQPVLVGTTKIDGSTPPQLTMDPQGNIWAIFADDLYEWPRTSSIDSAYTPTSTGVYYAVVTDMRGYAARTNPIVITVPSAGTPGISITATATSTPVCTPISFTANPVNPGIAPSYQWMVSGIPVGDGSLTYSYNLFADSDQVYCVMNTLAGCSGPVSDTSNTILLNIDPHGTASVKIGTPKDSVCKGDSVLFTATVNNGSTTPRFEWLLDGTPTTDTGPTYGSSNFTSGDVVSCIITSDDACGLAKSNSIPLTVSTPPAIEAGQIFTILHGHSETLEPVITGDVDSWLWTPASGLSNPAIANPIATPDSNTLYTLTVGAPGGCSATGTILVNVYIPLSIPGAFTPNGDGHNDLFYVLGGPINSRVEEFGVFNRFGGEVFRAHNVAPGDATHAWNGYFNGSPASAGTYVYFIRMKFADGHTQVYKGTVILIR